MAKKFEIFSGGTEGLTEEQKSNVTRLEGMAEKFRAINGSKEEREQAISQYIALLREKIGTDSGLGKTIKIASRDGKITYAYIDAKSVPNVVSRDNKPAECTISFDEQWFVPMVRGIISFETALMRGYARVGDIHTASALCRIVEGSMAEAA